MARETAGGPIGFLSYFLRGGYVIMPIAGAIYGFVRMQSWTAALIAAAVFTAVIMIPAIAGYRRRLRAQSDVPPAWMTRGQATEQDPPQYGERADGDGTKRTDEPR